MSHFSHSGANIPGNESSRDRKYQGAKVPPMVLSLLGAKVRGNESSSYWSRDPFHTLGLVQSIFVEQVKLYHSNTDTNIDRNKFF